MHLKIVIITSQNFVSIVLSKTVKCVLYVSSTRFFQVLTIGKSGPCVSIVRFMVEVKFMTELNGLRLHAND